MPLPRLPPSRRGLVEFVPTSKATALFAGRGEATALAVLVHGLDDPVDARITADGLVLRVDKDDFVVLVRRVLVDPVRVEDAEIGAAAADALLGSRLERPLVLELVDTLVGGLAWMLVRCLNSISCSSDRSIPYVAPLDPLVSTHMAEMALGELTWARASCDHHGGHECGR